MERPSSLDASVFGGPVKIPEIEIAASPAPSTDQGLFEPAAEEMWPPLTQEKLLSTYNTQKRVLEDWEEKFEDRKGRKPHHEDLARDLRMQVSRYEDLNRFHKNLFPKPQDLLPASLPFMPPEVWGMVFRNLSLDDLKSCQLSSRLWANMAWRYISETGTFLLSRESLDLERLERHGHSDRVRRKINSLTFSIGGFGRMSTNVVRDILWRRISFPHEDVRKMLVKAGVTEYQTWQRRKMEAAQNYDSYKTLKAALQNIEEIKSLTIAMDCCNWQSKELRALWSDSTYWDYDPKYIYIQAAKELKTILVATKRPELKSVMLRGISMKTFTFLDKWTASETYQPFEHIEDLVAVIDPWNPLPRLRSAQMHRNQHDGLVKLLKSAPDLKRLHLNLTLATFGKRRVIWSTTSPRRMWLWRFDFGAAFNTKPWTKLTELFLGGFVVGTGDLLRLLKAHASTLRSLDLCNLRCEGSIELFLREIRNLPICLDRFHVFGAWSSPDVKPPVGSDGDTDGRSTIVLGALYDVSKVHVQWEDQDLGFKLNSRSSFHIQEYVLRRIDRLEPRIFNEGFAKDFDKKEEAVEEVVKGLEDENAAEEQNSENVNNPSQRGQNDEQIVEESAAEEGQEVDDSDESAGEQTQDVVVGDDAVEDVGSKYTYEVDEGTPLTMWQLNSLDAEEETDWEGFSDEE